jgi:hypothetical protein
MSPIEAKFKFEQETKGAVRYQEVDEKGEPEYMSPKIGSLYLRKSVFEGASFPQTLCVRIEIVDG